MKISSSVMRKGFVRTGLVAAAMAATACAFAQSHPEAIATPAVMTDTEPLPAEERDSVGAVVLETSMVRAQREAFASRSTPARVNAVGRNADRTARAARTREDLAEQRDDAQMRLHEMGAGALTAP